MYVCEGAYEAWMCGCRRWGFVLFILYAATAVYINCVQLIDLSFTCVCIILRVLDNNTYLCTLRVFCLMLFEIHHHEHQENHA